MGYGIGAIKYYIGMLTSVWGVITAYLFAKGVFRPLDYLNAASAVLNNLKSPDQAIIGLVDAFFTTPGEAVTMVLIGLAIMTVLWFYGSVTS